MPIAMIIHLQYPFKINMNRLPYVPNHQEFLIAKIHAFFFYFFHFKVNVSELGLVTQGGKVVWGKYAQVTNHPENDGCINAVLLV